MNQDKMHLVNKIFNNETIRTVWDKDQEKYFISIVDLVGVLSESDRPQKYWSDLKSKLKKEGSEVSEKIGQLKLKSVATDGFTHHVKDKIDSLSKEEFEVWMRYHLSTCEREELQGYSNHMLYICKKN